MKKLAAIFLLFFAFLYLGASVINEIYNPPYDPPDPISLTIIEDEVPPELAFKQYPATPESTVTITKQPETAIRIDGFSSKISVEAVSTNENAKELTYLWYVASIIGDGDFVPARRIKRIDENNFTFEYCTDPEISISNEKVGYKYCCQVSNGVDTVTSDVYTISNFTIRSEIKDLTVEDFDTATFSFSISHKYEEDSRPHI